jgi:hypothetical protein
MISIGNSYNRTYIFLLDDNFAKCGLTLTSNDCKQHEKKKDRCLITRKDFIVT